MPSDVATGQSACVAIMHGRRIVQPQKLLRLIRGGGTPNQGRMAITAGLYEPSLQAEAVPAALQVLERDEREGPASPELFPPQPHGSMYSMELVGRVGCPFPEIAARSAVVLGWLLRLVDLVIEPTSQADGLPGGRAPLLASLDRRHLAQEWAVVRGRQGVPNAVLRGTGGRARKNPDQNSPAWWLRKILDGPVGPQLLAGPLSREAPLPPAMRLPLTVWRWDGGTLAAFADPGPENRDRFLARGSKASRRTGRPEPVVDWIMVDWGGQGRARKVTVGQNWTIPAPAAPAGASVTRIPGPGRAPAAVPSPSLAGAVEIALGIAKAAESLP